MIHLKATFLDTILKLNQLCGSVGSIRTKFYRKFRLASQPWDGETRHVKCNLALNMEELLEVVKELSFLNGQSANHGKLNVMSI